MSTSEKKETLAGHPPAGEGFRYVVLTYNTCSFSIVMVKELFHTN